MTLTKEIMRHVALTMGILVFLLVFLLLTISYSFSADMKTAVWDGTQPKYCWQLTFANATEPGRQYKLDLYKTPEQCLKIAMDPDTTLYVRKDYSILMPMFHCEPLCKQ